MGDSEDEPASNSIPAWQRRGGPDDKAPADPPPPDRLQVARRFLDNEEVKEASRDKKIEFLKAKGLQDDEIEGLLGQAEATAESHEALPHAGKPVTETEATGSQQQDPASPVSGIDRPPIVTYPEFLAKRRRPPPLVTTNGLFATLYAFAGLSTLIYGTSRYLVAPMVDSLTDARSELYGAASKRLDALVSKLEKAVSEVPPSKAQPVGDADDSSDADDPTEMFHRDVGTQTSSIPVSPVAPLANEPQSRRQADRLLTASKSLSCLKDQLRAQSEDLQDTRTLLGVFRDDLDGMIYSGHAQFVGRHDMYGISKRPEPEDEIRKVRDNIRRVKGVLLSTRNFPPSVR